MPQENVRSAQDAPPTTSDVYRSLSEPYCRYVLYHLYQRRAATVSTLVDAVGYWAAAGFTSGEPTTDEELTVALHHVHLPALADRGLVDYDAEAGVVELATVDATLRTAVDLALAQEYETA